MSLVVSFWASASCNIVFSLLLLFFTSGVHTCTYAHMPQCSIVCVRLWEGLQAVLNVCIVINVMLTSLLGHVIKRTLYLIDRKRIRFDLFRLYGETMNVSYVYSIQVTQRESGRVLTADFVWPSNCFFSMLSAKKKKEKEIVTESWLRWWTSRFLFFLFLLQMLLKTSKFVKKIAPLLGVALNFKLRSCNHWSAHQSVISFCY